MSRTPQVSAKRSPRRWLYLATLWLVILPGIPFLSISLGMVVYASWPSDPGDWSVAAISPDTRALTLITHGKGGHAGQWAQDMAHRIGQNASTPHEQALAVDWQEGADSMLRCSRNASVIGRSLARQLAQQAAELERVHFIAHSAGCFMAYALCRELKSLRPDIEIENTYLDASGIYRAVDWGYGQRHFGRCADTSQAYYNVGDGVPGSEGPLATQINVDISDQKPSASMPGHLWPIHYYRQLLSASATE